MLDVNGLILRAKARGFVTAEISANHNGSLTLLKDTIHAAHSAGVDAVKIQTYEADDIVIDKTIKAKGLWARETLHELYTRACTPYEWQAEAFEFARNIGCLLYSSPFSPRAVKVLAELHCPIVKIASNELTNIRIEHAIREYMPATPVFVSLGAVDNRWDDYPRQTVVAYHCQAVYPADDAPLAMRRINDILLEGYEAGWSCHMSGYKDNHLHAATLAAGAGATFFERHFSLDLRGADAAFSSNYGGMIRYVEHIRECVANCQREFTPNIENTRVWWATRDIAYDEKLEPGVNCDTFRPYIEGAISAYENVLGYRATASLKAGEPIKQESLR